MQDFGTCTNFIFIECKTSVPAVTIDCKISVPALGNYRLQISVPALNAKYRTGACAVY